MFVIRLHRAGNGIRVQPAIRRRLDRREHDAAKNRGTTGLVNENMIVMAGQDFLATLAMRQHRAEIRLRTAGHKQRRLLAKELCRLLLKRVYRRIIAIDIIADIRGGHHRAHAFGRLCHRVASHIDPRRGIGRLRLGASCVMHPVPSFIPEVPKGAREPPVKATYFAATKAFRSKAGSLTSAGDGDSSFSRHALPSM